jgi:polyhydroxyalkanoate synthase subunit PhaC
VLTVCDRVLGPSALRLPILGVVNTSDEIVPPQSMAHFLDSVPGKNARLITYPGETGVCFQHLALLVGRQAKRLVWPEIAAWM